MIKDMDFKHKCFICKKEFSTYSAGAGWMYKSLAGKAIRWYCSYECCMKYRRPIEEKEREKATKYEQTE